MISNSFFDILILIFVFITIIINIISINQNRKFLNLIRKNNIVGDFDKYHELNWKLTSFSTIGIALLLGGSVISISLKENLEKVNNQSILLESKMNIFDNKLKETDNLYNYVLNKSKFISDTVLPLNYQNQILINSNSKFIDIQKNQLDGMNYNMSLFQNGNLYKLQLLDDQIKLAQKQNFLMSNVNIVHLENIEFPENKFEIKIYFKDLKNIFNESLPKVIKNPNVLIQNTPYSGLRIDSVSNESFKLLKSELHSWGSFSSKSEENNYNNRKNYIDFLIVSEK